MFSRTSLTCLFALAASLAMTPVAVFAAPAGDPDKGADVFRACAACHSLEPGRHRTGPSLTGVIGRKAGTVPGFHRYSPALKQSEIVWDEATLHRWFADPKALVPGNRMIFPGLKDETERADLIAYLAQASEGTRPQTAQQGGMMGMGGDLRDLKALGPEYQVTGVRYCGDTYEVTTEAGDHAPFWEFNLRFKTDGSDLGPEPGKPVIVGAGMMGDRASIVFSSPKEISAFIAEGC